MIRNKAMAKLVLEALRDHDSPYMRDYELRRKITRGDESGRDHVDYHILLLADIGLIITRGQEVRLSWRGHDILEQETDDSALEIWAKLGS